MSILTLWKTLAQLFQLNQAPIINPKDNQLIMQSKTKQNKYSKSKGVKKKKLKKNKKELETRIKIKNSVRLIQ